MSIPLTVDQLREQYDRLKAEGELLAGGLLEIPRRVAILTYLYLDSGHNHTFSLVAAHGALWGASYFETGGSLGRFIAKRYFYSPRERAFRLGILREFADAFRRVNRQVCIDTYANYEFCRKFGDAPDADQIIPSPLLETLNRIHHARQQNRVLDADSRRACFVNSFRCEQEITVAPGVAEAIANFECKIMRWLCLHPLVRFAYFPRLTYLRFRDFGNTDERIAKGLRAYDLAEKAQWESVFASMDYYGIMPRNFVTAPQEHFHELRNSAIAQARRLLASEHANKAEPSANG